MSSQRADCTAPSSQGRAASVSREGWVDKETGRNSIQPCPGWVCVSPWPSLEWSERKKLSWRNASMIPSSKASFSASDQWGPSLSFRRKWVEKARVSKPVNRTPPWPPQQLLPPGSRPAWISIPTSSSDELWSGSVSRENPFFLPPQFAF